MMVSNLLGALAELENEYPLPKGTEQHLVFKEMLRNVKADMKQLDRIRAIRPAFEDDRHCLGNVCSTDPSLAGALDDFIMCGFDAIDFANMVDIVIYACGQLNTSDIADYLTALEDDGTEWRASQVSALREKLIEMKEQTGR